ncbi:ATP-binding protein [Thermanaerothrix sp.]|uniref:ATP-binding protein n=1 Tax=Thermanaerothrix sp. TaxID=2972675 RepID=UPI003C7B1606
MASAQIKRSVYWLVYAGVNLILVLVVWGILSLVNPPAPNVESLRQLFLRKLGDWIVLYPGLERVGDQLAQFDWKLLVAILFVSILNTIKPLQTYIEEWTQVFSERLFSPPPSFIGDPPPVSDPLDFASGKIAFVGRDEVQQQLDNFLKRPESFLWWFLTGGAGVGKSRLALEWVQKLRKKPYYCHAGFYQGGMIPEWRPKRPTVIVVDNAAEFVDDVFKMLNSFTQSGSKQGIPLRVLLVERTMPESLKDLNEQDKYQRYRYQDALVLKNLSDQDIRALLGSKLSEKYIKRIISVSEGNPLLALAAKQLLLETGELKWQNRFELLEEWAKRMVRKYKQVGLKENYLPLIALATFARKLTLNDAREYIGGELPSKDMMQRILQQRVDNELPGITPDLFGEAFVLHVLGTMFYEDERKHFIRKGWEANPQGVASFLVKLILDFPTHSLIEELDTPPGDSAHLVYWCASRVTLIYVYGENGELEEMKRVLEGLKAVAGRYGGEVAIQAELAKGYVFAESVYRAAGQPQKAEVLIRKARRLRQSHL